MYDFASVGGAKIQNTTTYFSSSYRDRPMDEVSGEIVLFRTQLRAQDDDSKVSQ